MAIAKLAIACTSAQGATGTFLFKPHETTRYPVSPVFTSMVDLLAWCEENGWDESSSNSWEYEKKGSAIALTVCI